MNAPVSKAKALLKLKESMANERRGKERFYGRASGVFDPQNADKWCTSKDDQKWLKSNSTLYTSVGRNSIRRNTNFFMSNATPETGVWWGVKSTDPDLADDKEMSKWGKKVARQVQAEQRESMYIALRRAYREMFISYGIIYQGVRREYGKKTRKVFYQHVPSYACWYRKNIYDDLIQFAWLRSFTPASYYDEYGKEAGGKTSQPTNGAPGTDIQVLIVVEKNKDAADKPRKAEDHPYVERHVDVKNETVITTMGHMNMPFYEIKLDDGNHGNYPVGIAYDALPDALSANVARKTQMKALAFAGGPPLLAHGMDAVSQFGKQIAPSAVIEGGLNQEGKPLLAALQGMFNPEVLAYAVVDDEARVRDTFMQNELVQTHSDDITATAARIIAGERAALVAPFVNGIMPALTKMCENHIKLLGENGQLPEAPQNLGELEIDIVSPMAMQARGHDLASLVEALSHLGMVAQLDETVLAAFDGKEALKIISDATNLGHVFDLAKIEAAKKQVNDMMARQSQMQEGAAVASMAKDEAAALKTAGEAGVV